MLGGPKRCACKIEERDSKATRLTHPFEPQAEGRAPFRAPCNGLVVNLNGALTHLHSIPKRARYEKQIRPAPRGARRDRILNATTGFDLTVCLLSGQSP